MLLPSRQHRMTNRVIMTSDDASFALCDKFSVTGGDKVTVPVDERQIERSAPFGSGHDHWLTKYGDKGFVIAKAPMFFTRVVGVAIRFVFRGK
ncbi:hypothetical protein HY57_01285 [Dyella japonica A8]|uniref:Uncharacterized protein n=1 Tax=Dyella japonica A8 TaxID=1217721 RepID=A0A075K157_9GAMM|nr:hypothetical protein HY57_01285 [Dyella japonica A8]